MGCGAAEATGLGFVCFVVINPCVLSANRVFFWFILFYKFSNFTIQVGLDLIVQRAKMLDAEVKANPPSTKTLQIVLQGSVRLQVNAVGGVDVVQVWYVIKV